MKHLLNDISESENNRILEQYNNSLLVNTSKFKKLLESKLGDVKPIMEKRNNITLINEDSVIPFKNNNEGNRFRNWVNDTYPKIASGLKLDREGEYNNYYIQTAWNYKVGNYTLGELYSTLKMFNPVGNWTSNLQTDPVSKSKLPSCVSIGVGGEDWCSKINPNGSVVISAGNPDVGCSRFTRECLDDYRVNLRLGNAWDAFNNLYDWFGMSPGKIKYNLYDSLDWENIHKLVKQNKITKNLCKTTFTKVGQDSVNPIIRNMIINSNIIPNSSGVNVSSLELGDFVGVYYPGSKSMGHALCEKLIQNNLDDSSNFSQNKFTFNTHIGFVGAIKNGEPIIYHQTYDKWMATPAKLMLSKNSSDGMIAWVRQNPTVSSKTKKIADKLTEHYRNINNII